MNKTLAESMPKEFLGYEFDTCRAYKFRNVKVKSEHEGYLKRWPGPQKNVHFWVTLENGYCVGWNENPARGWSFPIWKIKETF